ncbi:LppU/SCO3897 family protein [Streptomyces poriticola]|uniref:LppU/SCO3897 family protein n=1 Tax=Streptomyces poriticola TaxID=3120506 RepID=UPI002FCE11DF
MSSSQHPSAAARPGRFRPALLAAAALGFSLALTGCGGADGSDAAAGSSSPSGPSSPYSPSPYTPESSDPYASPSEPPDPYESGTCLNGSLPTSTTAQEVDDVDEVSCSASDAHYKVIETIPLTSDLSRCEDNPRTQYAFSSRYTLNGATINEYVYCLIGLGSYAR